MNEEDLIVRMERFERNVATCLCIVPFLFSSQCLFVALAAPVATSMFADFGAKLPGATQFLLKAWPALALAAVALPIVAWVVARKCRPMVSLIFSTVSGMVICFLAQFMTLALFLPIFQLGAVAGG